MGVKSTIVPSLGGKQMDPEQYLRDVTTLMQAKLNDEILLIDAEKADFALNPIHAKAWYLDSLPKVFSYPRFVVYGIDKISPIEIIRGNSYRTTTLSFEVVLPDGGESESKSIAWQTLRYQRAMESVVSKNYDELHGIASLKVQQLLPIRFESNKKLYKTSGVSVEASFSAN